MEQVPAAVSIAPEHAAVPHLFTGKVQATLPATQAPAHSPVPHGAFAPRGCPDVKAAQVPRDPVRSHASQGALQARLQQTPSAEQCPEKQLSGLVHRVPLVTLPHRPATHGPSRQSRSSLQVVEAGGTFPVDTASTCASTHSASIASMLNASRVPCTTSVGEAPVLPSLDETSRRVESMEYLPSCASTIVVAGPSDPGSSSASASRAGAVLKAQPDVIKAKASAVSSTTRSVTGRMRIPLCSAFIRRLR